jgi:hypothetical protein
MFIRYTHFGIGHPVTLRKIIRDCFGFQSLGDTMDIAGSSNAEVDEDYEGNGTGESHDGCSDDEDEDEEELSDEELEDEANEGWEGDEDDDLLSF